MKRWHELDGLRGIGCFAVLWVHLQPSVTFWLWCALEMFFVLSGFLITGILMRADLSRPRALRNYLIRRSLRIWPVYYVGIALSLALWAAWSSYRGEASPFASDAWWKLLLYLQFSEGYFVSGHDFVHAYPGFVHHTWSLAVEEQYYLIWPLIIVALRKRTALLLVFCASMVALGVYLRDADKSIVLLGTRVDGLALGSMLAIAEQWRQGRDARVQQLLNGLYWAALGIGLAIVQPYIWVGYLEQRVQGFEDLPVYGSWRWNVLGFALTFTGLIGLMVNARLDALRRFLARPLFTWLGDRSYSIYMLHGLAFFAVLVIGRRIPAVPHAIVELVSVAAAIAVGHLSYLWIERKIEPLKRRFPVE